MMRAAPGAPGSGHLDDVPRHIQRLRDRGQPARKGSLGREQHGHLGVDALGLGHGIEDGPVLHDLVDAALQVPVVR